MAMIEDDEFDEEGEDDPEYPRSSATERVRKVLAFLLGVLMAIVLVLAFIFAVAGLAQYIGGPTE